MARITLANIISIVRDLINDPAGDSQRFTDDQIQGALDSRRDEARYIPMNEKPFIAAGGVVSFLTFDAPVGMWEDGATVVDQAFNVLSPTSVDAYNGRWTFATQPRYPVMITGFTHDIWGASADLLHEWATQESLAFDVKADGTELMRSQKAAALKARANDYLAKSRARSSELVRTDELTDPRAVFSDAWPGPY
jgi:hypothetical protein